MYHCRYYITHSAQNLVCIFSYYISVLSELSQVCVLIEYILIFTPPSDPCKFSVHDAPL